MSLTVKRIERLRDRGRYLDSHGLYLQVSETGVKSWLFRYERRARERWMGLGAVHAVTLTEARERARMARQQLLDGIDPLNARKEKNHAKAVEASRLKTFRECATEYLKANRTAWKNQKHAAQWEATLTTYAFPIIGQLPVHEIDTGIIIRLLEQQTDGGPLWTTKSETASRLRGRVEAILSWATVRGFRAGDNPARWRGHLKEALPTRSRRRNHLPALPFDQVASLLSELRQSEGSASKALEFLILTAARTNEVLGARWPEIDFSKKIWTIPADRMKSGRPHRIPLVPQAIAILEMCPGEGGDDGFVFVGARAGRPLSNMSMLSVMKALRPGYVPHGFRSSFRTWTAERGFPRDIAETALAHVLENKVEASYQRGDLLERRREMMAAWAQYCYASDKGATVTTIRKQG